MLKVLAIVALVIVVLVAGVIGLAMTRPDSFTVKRSIAIKAPPDKVFPLLEDFHRWAVWSPWEKKDPAMQRTFGGATSGKGATYAWSGDKNVGQGSMEILEAMPSSKVVIKLDFYKPFEAHNMAEFTLTPTAEGTNVLWSMYGPSPLIAKVMGLFMDMDKMVGPDFEAGLAAMKAAAEK
ncbi:MAG: SRPBCC family protein [Alphaproteobacteria bacterium]|nr:SRPBCC family protein [Alphaproteobacteria bacterium]